MSHGFSIIPITVFFYRLIPDNLLSTCKIPGPVILLHSAIFRKIVRGNYFETPGTQTAPRDAASALAPY